MVTSNQDTGDTGQAFDGWDDPADIPNDREALIVTLEGFEGPLDLLLLMARTQKVDLARISVLALAEQYLVFVERALKQRLELAADYLVMAAWLAFLKSRLLLPKEHGRDDEQPTGEELAARLAFRLKRLDAMRNAAGQLMTRKRLGRDLFTRGQPEGVRTIRVRKYTAMIFDLLKAYADQRRRTVKHVHVVPRRTVWTRVRGWRCCSASAPTSGCISIRSSSSTGPCPTSRARHVQARSAPPWRWHARASSRSRRPSRSPPSTCAGASRAPPGSG